MSFACVSLKTHVKTLGNFLYTLPLAAACSSIDDNEICYVHLVLWMTSRFCITGQTQIQGCILQRSKLFAITRQVAPLHCTLGGTVCYPRLPRYHSNITTCKLQTVTCLAWNSWISAMLVNKMERSSRRVAGTRCCKVASSTFAM